LLGAAGATAASEGDAMCKPDVFITSATDHRMIAELAEVFRLVLFAQENEFTREAPRLKVVRIRAVLDEPERLAVIAH
jgi:hypothetical protein